MESPSDSDHTRVLSRAFWRCGGGSTAISRWDARRGTVCAPPAAIRTLSPVGFTGFLDSRVLFLILGVGHRPMKAMTLLGHACTRLLAAGRALPGALARGLSIALIAAAHVAVGARADQTLLAPTPSELDLYGVSMCMNGQRLAVGAMWDDTLAGIDRGSVFVYERAAKGPWLLTHSITTPAGEDADFFGSTLDMVGDDLLATAYHADVNGSVDQGAAHLYRFDGSAWQHQQRLLASDGAADDYFGASGAMEGNTCVITARYDDVDGRPDQGSAYVFSRDASGVWHERQKLVDPQGAAADVFGFDVAIAGGAICVGSSWDDVGANVNQGSVTIFTRQVDGSYAFTQRLAASDGTPHAEFGIRVHAVGEYLFVGAPNAAHSGVDGRGAVYAFRRSASGEFVSAGKLVNLDGAALDGSGACVDEHAGTVAVGSSAADWAGRVDAGAIHLFRRTLDGEWIDVDTIVGAQGTPCGDNSAYFGTAVAFDAGELVGGAFFASVNGYAGAGCAQGSAIGAAADLNMDGAVDGADLAAMLSMMGRTDATGADIDLSGSVDGGDLAILLGAWTG